MALDPEKLRAWANGQAAGELLEDEDDAIGYDAVEEDEEAPHQALWAGEILDDEVTVEDAVACMEWLRQHEPELEDAIRELAAAYAADDERMVSHARGELAAVQQYLLADYAEMTEEQREILADELEANIEVDVSLESDEALIVIGKAIAVARASAVAEDEEEAAENVDEDDILEIEEEEEEALA